MGTEMREHAAALAIRVWIEPGSPAPEGLRARITSTVDLDSRDERVTAASRHDEILDEVSGWLARFLAAAE